MQAIQFLSLISLILVFLTSGATKLLKVQNFRDTLEGFHVDDRLIPLFSFAIPTIELIIAAGLFIPALQLSAGISALSLLLIFTSVISYSLYKGRVPSCNCFGKLSYEPISKRTIYRNVFLIIIAVVFCFCTSKSPRGLTFLFANFSLFNSVVICMLILITVAAVFCAWFLFHLLAQQGRLLLKLENLETFLGLKNNDILKPTKSKVGLPVGELSPDVKVEDREGKRTSLRMALSGQLPALLFFAEPNCGPCKTLIPNLEKWQNIFQGKLSFIIVTSGPPRPLEAYSAFENIFFQDKYEVSSAFGVTATPSVQIISPEGKIAWPLAIGPTNIFELTRQLIEQLNQGTSTNKPVPVDQLPQLELQSTDGRLINLSTINRDVLVLFWNPNCGYCQRMHARLNQLADELYGDNREFIIITSGSLDTNNILNEKAKVLLQNGSSAMLSFGVSGTPSAILYGANGQAQSGIAIGESQIMSLLGRKESIV